MISFVQKGIGGTLEYHVKRPIDDGGTPTVVLYTPGGGELVSSQGATQGPLTTLDDSAAAGQTTIPLASTSDLSSGEQYLVGPNTSGQKEIVTVDTITDGVSVSVRDDLLYSYVSTDIFRSQKLLVSVSADEADAVRANCRAQWTYESDSTTYVEESVFFISKYCPVCTVTEQDVLLRQPKARAFVSSRQPLAELIEDIFKREVLVDLAGQFDPSAVMSGERLHTAIIHRVLAQIYLSNDRLETYDKFFELYRADVERVFTVVDTDQDGSSLDEQVYHPFVGRFVRG